MIWVFDYEEWAFSERPEFDRKFEIECFWRVSPQRVS